MSNLPTQPAPLIGRETELTAAVQLVRTRQLVTLTGPGGIGKTRLAIEVAQRLLAQFADGVWIVDLAPVATADAVAQTIAALLNLGLDQGAVSPDQIAAELGSQHLLLVLDHCEHVILAAARLTAALLRASPAVHVLATSREPLLVEDEQVYRIPPLAVPAPDATRMDGTRMDGTLGPGAVELFFAWMRAAEPGFVPGARMTAVAGAICRRLDGIPLAIELAAARATAQGVRDVATQLDDHFKLLIGSRRTPLPRHKTLHATLDWSYGRLSTAARTTLQRIAVFTGPFGLDDARAVASGAEPDIHTTLHALVASSLVKTASYGVTIRYRLLEPIRAYSLDKLRESGEHDRIARRHADLLASEARPDGRREMPPCAPAQGFHSPDKRPGDQTCVRGHVGPVADGGAMNIQTSDFIPRGSDHETRPVVKPPT